MGRAKFPLRVYVTFDIDPDNSNTQELSYLSWRGIDKILESYEHFYYYHKIF